MANNQTRKAELIFNVMTVKTKMTKYFIDNDVYFEMEVKDDQGRKLPGGVYFVRFETQDYKETEKITILR